MKKTMILDLDAAYRWLDAAMPISGESSQAAKHAKARCEEIADKHMGYLEPHLKQLPAGVRDRIRDRLTLAFVDGWEEVLEYLMGLLREVRYGKEEA